MFVEWALKGKPSLLGMISGAVAGLVAVTPASGFAGPMGSIVLGLVVGAVCFFFVDYVKEVGYDDSLDVFGVHCVGGIIGAIATGILVAPYLGGVGPHRLRDETGRSLARGLRHGGAGADSGEERRLFTLFWSGFGSFILYKLVDLVIGLRVRKDAEMEGLDITSHGERAYNL